jgi:hypothetical protein
MLKICSPVKSNSTFPHSLSRPSAAVHNICDSVKVSQTQSATQPSNATPLVSLRYVQQLLAKHNIQKHKTSYCCNRQFSTSTPTLLLDNQKTTNIFHCRHTSCAVCSKKIYADKNSQLSKVFTYVSRKHSAASFHIMTLTIPHTQQHTLADRMEILAAIKRRLMDHKVVKQLNLLFFHTTLEIVYSKNGFHPHYHIMLCKISEITQQQIQAIANQYQKIAKAFKVAVNILKGFTIGQTTSIAAAATYLSKAQDLVNLANELVSDHKQYSNTETYTLPQLISLAANNQFNKIVYSKARVEKVILEFIQLKNINYFRGCKKYDQFVKLSANLQLPNTKKAAQPTKYIQINPKAFHALAKNNLLLGSQVLDSNNNVIQFEGLLNQHRTNTDLNDTFGYLLYIIEKNQHKLYVGIVNDVAIVNIQNNQLPFQQFSFSNKSSPSVSCPTSQLVAA